MIVKLAQFSAQCHNAEASVIEDTAKHIAAERDRLVLGVTTREDIEAGRAQVLVFPSGFWAVEVEGRCVLEIDPPLFLGDEIVISYRASKT